MPKLSLMGDNKISALLTWSNLKLSLTTTETLWAACGQAASIRTRQTLSQLPSLDVPKLAAMTAIDLAFLPIRNLGVGTDSREIGGWGDRARQNADTSDTSASSSDQALPNDERAFTHWVTDPVLESSVSPDLACTWSDAIHSHLISMAPLDDDCTPDDTDESCGHTGPSMAELMKEAFYQQHHPDSFLESDFPAHDFHKMVSYLPNASNRSSSPAIESDHSLAFLLRNM
eukprot:gene12711-15953_t